MPAPLPPAKPLRCFTRSEPPWPKPKLTRETGTSVTPSGVVIGSPTTVFTSTISLILDMLACRNSAIGVCICSIVILPFFFGGRGALGRGAFYSQQAESGRYQYG